MKTMRLRILHANEVSIEIKNGEAVCSISEISRLLNIDRATVAKTIRLHGVEPAGVRKKHPIYPLAVVAKRVINNRFW